jgi:hypothetical protein
MMCQVHNNNNTSVGVYSNHYVGPADEQYRSTRVHIYTKTGCVMSGQFGEKFRTPDRPVRNLVTIPTELSQLLHNTSNSLKDTPWRFCEHHSGVTRLTATLTAVRTVFVSKTSISIDHPRDVPEDSKFLHKNCSCHTRLSRSNRRKLNDTRNNTFQHKIPNCWSKIH